MGDAVRRPLYLGLHGGLGRVVAGKPLPPELVAENLPALEKGCDNLIKHIENALLFLLPTVLYLAYVLLATDTTDATTGQRKQPLQMLDEAPLVWLFAIGLLIMVATLLAFGTLQDQSIDKPYEPAIYKDGRILQGGKK